MFTKEQIEEIRQRLALNVSRDSDFPIAESLNDDDIITLVQDSINKKISISNFNTKTWKKELTREVLLLSAEIKREAINVKNWAGQTFFPINSFEQKFDELLYSGNFNYRTTGEADINSLWTNGLQLQADPDARDYVRLQYFGGVDYIWVEWAEEGNIVGHDYLPTGSKVEDLEKKIKSLSSVMQYKGSTSAVDDTTDQLILSQISSDRVAVGYVFTVNKPFYYGDSELYPAGTNIVVTKININGEATEVDIMQGMVDLSSYATQEYVRNIGTAAINHAKNYTDTKVKEIASYGGKLDSQKDLSGDGTIYTDRTTCTLYTAKTGQIFTVPFAFKYNNTWYPDGAAIIVKADGSKQSLEDKADVLQSTLVQPDWEQENENAFSFIKNKPNVYTVETIDGIVEGIYNDTDDFVNNYFAYPVLSTFEAVKISGDDIANIPTDVTTGERSNTVYFVLRNSSEGEEYLWYEDVNGVYYRDLEPSGFEEPSLWEDLSEESTSGFDYPEDNFRYFKEFNNAVAGCTFSRRTFYDGDSYPPLSSVGVKVKYSETDHNWYFIFRDNSSYTYTNTLESLTVFLKGYIDFSQTLYVLSNYSPMHQYTSIFTGRKYKTFYDGNTVDLTYLNNKVDNLEEEVTHFSSDWEANDDTLEKGSIKNKPMIWHVNIRRLEAKSEVYDGPYTPQYVDNPVSGLKDVIVQIGFSEDETTTPLVWEPVEGTDFPEHSSIRGIAFSADGKRIRYRVKKSYSDYSTYSHVFVRTIGLQPISTKAFEDIHILKGRDVEEGTVQEVNKIIVSSNLRPEKLTTDLADITEIAPSDSLLRVTGSILAENKVTAKDFVQSATIRVPKVSTDSVGVAITKATDRIDDLSLKVKLYGTSSATKYITLDNVPSTDSNSLINRVSTLENSLAEAAITIEELSAKIEKLEGLLSVVTNISMTSGGVIEVESSVVEGTKYRYLPAETIAEE